MSITISKRTYENFNNSWSPKITFEQLVKEMVNSDLKLAKND